MRIYPLTRAGLTANVTKREAAMPPLEEFCPTLGPDIKARRKELGLLQKQVAAMLDCTPQCISMIERGQRKPSWPFLIRLSQVLGIKATLSITRDST